MREFTASRGRLLTLSDGFDTIGSMYFEILGEISEVETFATGSAIREVARLRRTYGRGRWRKRKGIAHVRWRMARFSSPNYIGMKQLELGGKNSR